MGSYGFTYRFQIDFGHLGDYSHALADVTSRVKVEGSLNMGFTDPYGEIAPPSKLQFSLLNTDRLLSTGNTSSPYYGLLKRGTLVKFTLAYAGTTYLTWVGKIEKLRSYIHPFENPDQNNYIMVIAQDPMLQLLDAQIFPALQTNVLIHDAIAQILEDAATAIVFPYASYWSVLDVSVLDTAKLLNQSLYSYNPSLSEIEWVGDNAADENSTVGARSLIDSLMAAELGGRFFWDGEAFQFQDRYFSLAYSLAGITLELTAADIIDGDYRMGEDLVNDVKVTYQPRSVGDAGTVIFSSERAIQVQAGQTRTVTCHFRDADTPTRQIGAYDVLNLVSGTDFIANSVQDGSGTVLTTFISASQQAKAQSATITLRNTGAVDAWLTTLQLRGTPLYSDARETVQAVDAQSIYDNDRIPRSYAYKLVSDEETAQGFANIQVSRFKDQFERWHSVTFMVSDALKLITATTGIGSVITVNEQTSTKHNRNYTVVGIQHKWDKRVGEHRVTYILSPIASEAYWILGFAGYSELGTTNTLAL
jgi:hypothetical protein